MLAYYCWLFSENVFFRFHTSSAICENCISWARLGASNTSSFLTEPDEIAFQTSLYYFAKPSGLVPQQHQTWKKSNQVLTRWTAVWFPTKYDVVLPFIKRLGLMSSIFLVMIKMKMKTLHHAPRNNRRLRDRMRLWKGLCHEINTTECPNIVHIDG